MDKKIVQLLEDIKKLIILQLVKGGKPTSTKEIGEALGVTRRTIQNIATLSKKPKNKKSKKTNQKKKGKKGKK